MTKRQDSDRYIFDCDELGCDASCDTREGHFPTAVKIATRKGWVCRRSAFGTGLAQHFCPVHR